MIAPTPSIHRLRNPVQAYAWGSPTAIPRLLGREPTGEPQAELWMGDHPRAPSEIEVDGAWRPLDRVVREQAESLLGSGSGARQLPFLLKILAAEMALSIQAHPDRERAAAGFAREQSAGLPLEARERSYRDVNAKPEILLALTPFRLLRGFRAPADIVRRASASGLTGALPEAAEVEQPGGLRRFVRALLGLDGARLERVLDRVLGRLSVGDLSANDDAAREVLRLAEQFPGDRGVLGPLFLELFEVPPGEAVFTGPGVLHAYLGGVGVELMANSDNVLRGGLTAKHVDPDELAAVLRYEPSAPRLLSPRLAAGGAERRFEAPEAGLVLSDLRCRPGAPLRCTGTGARILLCVDGAARLTADSGTTLEVARGDSFLVPASVDAYRLEGDARLFRAEVR